MESPVSVTVPPRLLLVLTAVRTIDSLSISKSLASRTATSTVRLSSWKA